MAFDFHVIPDQRGRRARSRLREWFPQALCLVVALGVFIGIVASNADMDPGNLWAIPTVPLWISVFTGHIWRRARPAPDGRDVSDLLRKLRRITWRVALVLVFLAFALLWIASFWHWRASIADDNGDYSTVDIDAGHYSFFAGLWWWPLPVAGFLVLAHPILFWLARRHYTDDTGPAMRPPNLTFAARRSHRTGWPRR